MAAPTCSFCEQYQAVYMGTSIADGDTVCPCANCLPGMMLGMAAALVGGMSPDELAASQEALETICTAYGRPAQSKPPRKRSAPHAAKSGDQADALARVADMEMPHLDECPNCGSLVERNADGEYNCDTCQDLAAASSAPE